MSKRRRTRTRRNPSLLKGLDINMVLLGVGGYVAYKKGWLKDLGINPPAS